MFNDLKENLIAKSIILSVLFLFATALYLLPKNEIKSESETYPSDMIFIQGNSLTAITSPSNPEPQVIRELNVIVTAYSSTVMETDDTPFITAAGTMVKEGIIANNLLPFGTKIKIPELYGDKIFIVEDRMAERKGNYHFDIWFPSYWEALNFGAKNTIVEVLES